jgi:stage II sporulation protein D
LNLGKIFLFLLFCSHAWAAEPKINVRIGKWLKNVTVKGIDLKKKIFSKKSRSQIYPGRKIIKFNCLSKRKNLFKKPRLVASLSTQSGIIDWEDKKYRGKLMLLTSADNTSCDLVNQMSLENYISSLLAAEMRNDWPIEALKAQAIAARTYALHKIESQQVKNNAGYETYYDLENSEKHQVNGTLYDESPLTRRAALKTRGQILKSKNGKLTPIFFHSKCGGQTILPQNIWSNPVAGYKSVDCPNCHPYGKKPWKTYVDEYSFKKTINELYHDYKGEEVVFKKEEYNLPITLLSDTTDKRFIRFYKNGELYTFKKSYLRKVLGRRILPSNNFEILYDKNGYRFVGTGYGHGAGLCQFGAYAMALKGKTYKQILAHYFPGHKIENIY